MLWAELLGHQHGVARVEARGVGDQLADVVVVRAGELVLDNEGRLAG